MIYVPSSQEVQVAQEAEQYRRFRQARAMLAKLSRQALAVIDELEQALETNQKIGGPKKRSPTRRKPRKTKG
jgi:molecular chaperone GrpE (heat shock protein)